MKKQKFNFARCLTLVMALLAVTTVSFANSTPSNRFTFGPGGGASESGSATNFQSGPRTGNAYLAGPSILLVGDSTSSQNDSFSGNATGALTMAITRYQKAFTWLDNLTGGALNYETTFNIQNNTRDGSNAARGGASITEVTTKITTGDANSNFVPLKNFPQKYFWVQVGTNDINSGTSLATLITNYTAMVKAITDAGKIPILTTVLPRNAVDGVNDWGAVGTTAAQKRLVLNSFNRWIVEFARENNIICVNWTAAFSDETGNAKTGYTTDSLHPNARGSYYLALEALRQVGFLFPKGRLGQQNGYDVYDATYNPYGNILNGDLSGTGGSLSAGSGTGTVTGTVADNFQLSKNTSTTTSVVASLVTRNGMLAQKLVFTSAGTGSSAEDWRYSYWSGSSTSLGSYATAGDNLKIEAGFEVEAGTEGVLRAVQPRVSMNAGVTVTASTISFNATTNTINDSGNGLAGFPVNAAINVAGSASNNNVYRVTAVTAGTLTISPLTPVTTEAAGASISLRLPALASSTNASGENYPNENTGVYWVRAPHFVVPTTGNISPRFGFYINGTIAGTATVYIYRPSLNKMPFKPSVLNYVATDN